MNKEKLETLKELIDSFDTEYYHKENDKLDKEINNIQMGRPRYEGIHDLIYSDVVPKYKREQEIKRLKNKIKDNKEKAKELGKTLSQLRSSADKLERLAEQDILLDVFKHILYGRESKEIRETDIYKENAPKYSKWYSKSIKPITHSQHKISKEMYKIIKANLKERAYETNFGHISLETAFKINEIDLRLNKRDQYAPGNEIFSDFQRKYLGYLYSENIQELGVDVSKIEYAMKQIVGILNSNSLTWHGEEAFDKLKNIEKVQESRIKVKGGYSKLIEIKEKYTEIVELSRETWYLDEILEAFSDTDITKTEMYKGLQELVREQEQELWKLTSEIDKLYEKTGLQNKIDLIKQLEELYRKTEELNLKIEQYKNIGDYTQVNFIQQDYFNVRYEMIKILKDNPDLNNPKYNIDIEKIIKREKELFEPEIKKELKQDSRLTAEKLELDPIIEQPVVEKTNDIDEIPQHIPTKKEEKIVEKAYIEEADKVVRLELDSNLQIHRTMHYQNYMREKVLNSDLGKISFSAYLEAVAPHLINLIKIEKERESLARTIYRDYIKYLSSLENKKEAVSFYEFSGNNYGISNVDVPIEFEEEYKGMKI